MNYELRTMNYELNVFPKEGRKVEEKFNLKKPQLKKLNQLLILAAVGILLIMLAGVFSSKDPVEQGQKVPNIQVNPLEQGKSAPADTNLSDQVNTEENFLEAKLEDSLAGIEGAGKVEVTVRLAGTTQQEFAEEKTTTSKSNQERDERGGTRTTLEKNENGKPVIIRSSGSGDVPVIKHAVRPEIKGVLVVAEGAGNLETRELLTEAVTTLLDLPANKVRVVPRKTGKN